MVIPEPREHLRQMIAQILLDRLYDLGSGTRDEEGTSDGGLLLDAVEPAAEDLAKCVVDDLFLRVKARDVCLPLRSTPTHREYEIVSEPVAVEETP